MDYNSKEFLDIEIACLRAYQQVRGHVLRECERLELTVPPFPPLIVAKSREIGKSGLRNYLCLEPSRFEFAGDDANASSAIIKRVLAVWRSAISEYAERNGHALPEWDGEAKAWPKVVTGWLKCLD